MVGEQECCFDQINLGGVQCEWCADFRGQILLDIQHVSAHGTHNSEVSVAAGQIITGNAN